MPKFRSRPRVVDAEQYSLERHRLDGYLPTGVHRRRGTAEEGYTYEMMPFVTTIHGNCVTIQDGDWIIAEPDGEHFYPCKPEIFEANYEPAE